MQLFAVIAGALLGRLFNGIAKLKGGRPLHPRGVVLHGTLHRLGSADRMGVPLLDEAGKDSVIVRLSRGGGLPGTLPDILGLAIRRSAFGSEEDLLMSTAGLRGKRRHVLRPTRDLMGSYTTVFPYDFDGGRVVIAAVGRSPSSLPATTSAVTRAVSRAPLRFELLFGVGGKDWQAFAILELTSVAAESESNIHFDPMINAIDGLRFPRAVTSLRAPAYRGARVAL